MGQCLCCEIVCNKSIQKIDDLQNVDDDKIQLFTLDKQVHQAKIVRVYDGDTCFAVIKLHNEYVKFKVRMEGYDSPEMKPSLENKNREKEKKDAQKAKEELEKHVLNKVVLLHCGKWDKYGRLLGTIFITGNNVNINVNELMIKDGFGYVYDGGTKKEFK
jgi:endonuclease YncB( thermonuclease family)